MFGDKAPIIAPIAKTNDENKITFLRPYLSEKCPANIPPNIAPSIRIEVIQPMSAGSSIPQSIFKNGRAPVITPIS